MCNECVHIPCGLHGCTLLLLLLSPFWGVVVTWQVAVGSLRSWEVVVATWQEEVGSLQVEVGSSRSWEVVVVTWQVVEGSWHSWAVGVTWQVVGWEGTSCQLQEVGASWWWWWEEGGSGGVGGQEGDWEGWGWGPECPGRMRCWSTGCQRCSCRRQPSWWYHTVGGWTGMQGCTGETRWHGPGRCEPC
jgi:hypothetical protein